MLISQHYIRGQVVNKYGQRLPSVKIFAAGSNQSLKSDLYGNFGVTTVLNEDTFKFYCDGYDTLSSVIKADNYARIILKPLPSSVILTRKRRSIVIEPEKVNDIDRSIRDETYKRRSEYNFLITEESPGIAFSANINRASYSNVRRLINEMEYLLPPYAVRIEEMLNYFNFDYTEPGNDSMFHCASHLTNCPWNKANHLLFVNISARKIDMHNIPPNNLVFLIDASGSMDMPNKLPLLKSGFIKMVKNLRPIDTVSIVTFGGSVNILLDGVSGVKKDSITHLIETITADGSTPGEAGIKTAFKLARKKFIAKGNNRIILAADGDFNVGASNEKDLIRLIEEEKKSGIYLTCLGVGSGNYKDSKLSILAEKGNGNFSYIDNEEEAERVLVTDLTKTLFTVADNVFLSMNFNSRAVLSYKLLGYENENMLMKDSAIELRGGEIGSGHSLMAIFEIEPTLNFANNNSIATLQVHYQKPLLANKFIISYNCSNQLSPLKAIDINLKKAASVAMFGMKLKDNEYAACISWKSLQKFAAASLNRDNYLEKEFLQLINKAKKMYTHRKKYGGE